VSNNNFKTPKGLAQSTQESAESSEESFDHVYGQYRQELKNYFRKFPSVRDSVEDLIQQTFISVWRRRKDEKIRDPLKYLFALARHALRKESNRLKDEAQISISADSLSVDRDTLSRLLVADNSSSEVNRDELLCNLEALPTEQLRMLCLHYLEGLTVDEISALTDTKRDTVKALLKRAMRHLRGCYGEDQLRKQLSKQQRKAQ
jgi:RNA polymerase sigma-70 factor, ECF subfamily